MRYILKKDKTVLALFKHDEESRFRRHVLELPLWIILKDPEIQLLLLLNLKVQEFCCKFIFASKEHTLKSGITDPSKPNQFQ